MGLFEAALDDERLMENILYEDNTDGDPIEKNEGFTNYPLDPVIFGQKAAETQRIKRLKEKKLRKAD